MKYMLTIQHESQKVAYIEFQAENKKQAEQQAETIFKDYQAKDNFIPRMPYVSGNFSGMKPRVKSHHVSKWVGSDTACNAWGVPCGGYWSSL